MGDENPIRTLGDYSKSSHEGYMNTIELPVGNNVVPLRSDTIRLVQNGCSFHELRFEDPNQHLKDFLKLMDSLDLDSANRERTRLQSLSEAWTHFKDLLQKVPYHGIDHWLQIQIFYDHVSFHLKCEIDRAAGGKLHNKNDDESWEIIENLALYDHEGWNDTKEFVKPVKDISTPQGISKTPDRRLLELEDQINFLLKGSRPTPRSLTHIPHAYADVVYSQSRNKPPKLNPFTFCERTCPSPQPQALGITFEARVRDYMAAHTKRMERFKNAFFKQREEITDRMTEMFGLLKELTTSRTPEKVLIREEAKFPVTKNVNSISLARGEEERNDKTDETLDNTVKPAKTETEIPLKEAERNNETKNKPIKKAEEEEVMETLSSRSVEYYLKHRINEKLIEGLVDNDRFNDSLSRAQVGKVKGKTYNVLPRGPVYEAILKKKITKKEDIRGYFKILCSIGGLKHMNALIDQGPDVNVMPYSRDSKPFDTLVDLGSCVNITPLYLFKKLNIRLLEETDHIFGLADGTKSYPVGIVKDVEVHIGKLKLLNAFYVIDMKKDPETPLLVGRGFLATANVVIDCRMATIAVGEGITRSVLGVKGVDLGEEEAPYWTTLGKRESYKPVAEHVYPMDFFDKGIITLRSRKSKISFHRIRESSFKIEKGVKNDIEPIAHAMTVNRLVLEWEEKIKLHLEKEMKFNQWMSNNFKGKHPAPVKAEGGMNDNGEVT
ncbi:MAK10-like protein [Tanacetum coccineum]